MVYLSSMQSFPSTLIVIINIPYYLYLKFKLPVPRLKILCTKNLLNSYNIREIKIKINSFFILIIMV